MQFYTPDGTPIDRPREWEPALLDLECDPDDWEAVHCAVNGREAVVYAGRRVGESRTLVDWPRGGPGSYEVRVESPSGIASRTVVVGSSKLGDDGLAALIEDLEERLPTSIAVGLRRAGGLAGVRLEQPSSNTMAQELVRLQRAVDGHPHEPGLSRLLPSIAGDPHHTLTREDRWVRREHARRVYPSALVQALVRPGNLEAESRPERVLDSRTTRTVDVYENRLLKSFLEQVRARAHRLVRVTAYSRPEVSGLASELLARLDDAERRAPFLREVHVTDQPLDRLTMVLAREPRYRALLHRFREFHRSLWIELAEPRLAAPLHNLPDLYQVWGTLCVTDALLEVAVELGYEVVAQRITYRRPNELFVRILTNGEPALRLRRRADSASISLTPEPTFGRQTTLRSTSFPQRPDVVIEHRKPGSGPHLLVFDPKYKLDADDEGSGTPVKSDIDKMHAYRDAIRDLSGERVVQFAATLYPGASMEYGDGLAAIEAVPGREATLVSAVRELLRRYLS